MSQGPDSLNPPYKSGDEADRGKKVAGQSVVSRCDTPKIPQPVECALDAPSFFIEPPVEAEQLFSAAPIGNDRLGSAILKP
jgi:hypothetical protein